MVRKSTDSNAWAGIFKNADFSKGSLKVTKLSKYHIFPDLKFFSVSIIKKMTFIVSVKSN